MALPAVLLKAKGALKKAKNAYGAAKTAKGIKDGSEPAGNKILGKNAKVFGIGAIGCAAISLVSVVIVLLVISQFLGFIWSNVTERLDNTIRGSCIFCTDEEFEEIKETQFVKKIEAIKEEYGSRVDVTVLASTVLYQKVYSDTIDSLYEEGDDDEAAQSTLNTIQELLRHFNESGDDDYNGITQEEIDILEVAAAIMVNSSGDGSYNEENYKAALASNGMSTDAVENAWLCFGQATASVADIINQYLPGVTQVIDLYELITSGTYRDATDAELLAVNKAGICTVGYIGTFFPSVAAITDDDLRQVTKEQIAQEIIDFADYYEYLFPGTTVTSGGSVCYYNIPGIDEEVSNIKVQTIQCEYGNISGSLGDDISTEDLIDFETTYIAGVVYAEVGGANLETKKAQAVAARSYALTRGNAMNGALNIGLSVESGQWVLRIRTCTSDQVFCHPDLGCGSENGSMQGTTSGGYTVYAGGYNGNLTREPISEDDEIWTAVNETKGQVAVNFDGEVVYTTFTSSAQNAWASAVSSGSTYKEAIIDHYSSVGVVDVTSDCRGGVGDYDFEAYYVASESAYQSSNTPENDLASSEYGSVEAFNQHIKDNINAAGYGTREAVVTAGVSLVGDYILATGKRLRYSQSSRQGQDTEGIVNTDFYLDCSSFAWWAVYNAGFKTPSYPQTGTIGTWASENGYLQSGVSGGQGGDFLLSSGHIVLILGTYDGGYYCAEFSSRISGAKISKRSYSSLSADGYQLIDMTDYYNDSSNLRR